MDKSFVAERLVPCFEVGGEARARALRHCRSFAEDATRQEFAWARLARGDGAVPLAARAAALLREWGAAGDVAEAVARPLSSGPGGGDVWGWSWMAAARLPEILSGAAVVAGAAPRGGEWAVHQVWDCKGPSGASAPGRSRFVFAVLTGGGAGTFWAGPLSRRDCVEAAPRLGFTWRGREPRRWRAPAQLVGLRFLSRGPEPLEEDDGPRGRAAMRLLSFPLGDRWNRAVLTGRVTRRPPCPFDFPFACHECPVGFLGWGGATRCPVAVHPGNWALVACRACGREVWDRGGPRPACSECGGPLPRGETG